MVAEQDLFFPLLFSSRCSVLEFLNSSIHRLEAWLFIVFMPPWAARTVIRCIIRPWKFLGRWLTNPYTHHGGCFRWREMRLHVHMRKTTRSRIVNIPQAAVGGLTTWRYTRTEDAIHIVQPNFSQSQLVSVLGIYETQLLAYCCFPTSKISLSSSA